MPGMIYTTYRNNRFELKVAIRHSNIANDCLFFTKKNNRRNTRLEVSRLVISGQLYRLVISGQRSTYEIFTSVCVWGGGGGVNITEIMRKSMISYKGSVLHVEQFAQ